MRRSRTLAVAVISGVVLLVLSIFILQYFSKRKADLGQNPSSSSQLQTEVTDHDRTATHGENTVEETNPKATVTPVKNATPSATKAPGEQGNETDSTTEGANGGTVTPQQTSRPANDPEDEISATVETQNFGALFKMSVKVKGVQDFPAVKYQVFSEGKAFSEITDIGTPAAIFPAKVPGDVVSVKFLTVDGTVVGAVDVALKKAA